MKQSFLARDTGLDAKLALLDGGSLQFFAAPKPADANTDLSGQTLLASCAFGSPAFASAANGVATANAVTNGVGLLVGSLGWARGFGADGVTTVGDFSVGLVGSGADVLLTTLSIDTVHAVNVNAMTVTSQDGT
jgi:hypothetical protein